MLVGFRFGVIECCGECGPGEDCRYLGGEKMKKRGKKRKDTGVV